MAGRLMRVRGRGRDVYEYFRVWIEICLYRVAAQQLFLVRISVFRRRVVCVLRRHTEGGAVGAYCAVGMQCGDAVCDKNRSGYAERETARAGSWHIRGRYV